MYRDIEVAIDAIHTYTDRGDLSDGLIFDAVRVRLIEVGEAVKGIDPDILANEPNIPWADIAGMRDHLAYRYFDTTHAIVRATVEQDLPPLLRAVRRLHTRVTVRFRIQTRESPRARGRAPTRSSCSGNAATAFDDAEWSELDHTLANRVVRTTKRPQAK